MFVNKRPRHSKVATLENIADYLKNAAVCAITGFILFTADVHGVMLHSKKIFHSVLLLSYVVFAVFCFIGGYLTFIVGRTNPHWENTHMQYIYVAASCMVLGSVLWMMAVWPVFHIWTIPLGFCAAAFFVTLLTLVPSAKPKES